MDTFSITGYFFGGQSSYALEGTPFEGNVKTDGLKDFLQVFWTIEQD